jgi:hypothetical protein
MSPACLVGSPERGSWLTVTVVPSWIPAAEIPQYLQAGIILSPYESPPCSWEANWDRSGSWGMVIRGLVWLSV